MLKHSSRVHESLVDLNSSLMGHLSSVTEVCCNTQTPIHTVHVQTYITDAAAPCDMYSKTQWCELVVTVCVVRQLSKHVGVTSSIHVLSFQASLSTRPKQN